MCRTMPPTRPSTTAVVRLPCGSIVRCTGVISPHYLEHRGSPCSTASRAVEGGFLIQNDADGDRLQDGLQAAFGTKCPHEDRFFELVDNFGRDASPHEHPTGCHHFESQIPSLCTIECDKEV